MSKSEALAFLSWIVLAGCAGAVTSQPASDAIGRTPTAAEIAAWDQWVAPDGDGLPSGRGSVAEGEVLYAQRCASCHGPRGEGGENTALVGGRGTLDSAAPVKTVESYWPYATTLWDYVHRAMPFDFPGTLTVDQVYALVAYILYLGDIVPHDAVLDAQTLPEVQMPNRDGFIPDPRPDLGGTQQSSKE